MTPTTINIRSSVVCNHARGTALACNRFVEKLIIAITGMNIMNQSKTTGTTLLRNLFVVVLLSWGLTSTCFAQTKASRIDTLMHRLVERGQFNGSVLVAEEGKVIYETGLGYADIDHGIDFTPATPCYLASLAKQFTAVAVMMLAERHKLSYADPLSKYFPEFLRFARGVTMRHLLNHTSGIPDYVRLGLEHAGLTNKDVLNALMRLDSLNFSPGERFEYSNSGYVLLAMIIEQVSGERYGVFMKKNVFDPLGMNNTFVEDGALPEIPGRARGYSRFNESDDYNLRTVGEGGIYSSAHDLFKWDQALYTEKLVKQSTLAEAFTRAKLNDGSTSNYGFGWGIGEYDGETTTSHAGRYGGFNTYIKRFLRERNTIIFLTNHDFKNMSAIGNALTNILYDNPYSLPKLSVAELLYRLCNSDGITSTLDRYRSLRQRRDTTYDFEESELNELGYEFLGNKKMKEAIEILRLNAEEYPASWNVYDGLGEAYMENGERELAIRNYRKSLELNPENSNAVSMLKKLNQQ